MFDTFKRHWPEYLMEAAGLGIFMISACLFTALLVHPASPVQQAIDSPLLRRVLIGVAMGLTAIGIIFSPWGKQSGAHINPSITLAFFRLGKIAPWDAFFYIMFQFAGALAGVLLAVLLLGQVISAKSVNYVVTIPGPGGQWVAFLAEVIISFGLMMMVLVVTNTRHLARYTGLFAGAVVALYISVEAPLSGMSMNPARTFGSALPANLWTGLWIYFIGPPIAMLLAAELYLRVKTVDQVICAKLHHMNNKRCIFRNCGYKKNKQGD